MVCPVRLLSSTYQLTCRPADQSETLLWEEMVLYHQNRIENSYIPNLRASFKTYDAIHMKNDIRIPENEAVSDATLSVLRNLLFDRNINFTSTLEKHTRLIIASYHLRQTKTIEEVLYSSPSATSGSKRLWMDICLLARLQVAFQKFKEIALKLPSFEHVTIVLVPRPLAPANPSQRPLNLKQTFGILHLNMGPATTKAVLGHNWTVSKIEREFAQRQKQKPNIHAEVQMLMFLNTDKSSASGVFPYFGCSKLSCFMCDRFIRSHGQFTTRGCHGRLFKPWTLPSMDQLLPGQADRTAEALILVQKEVKKKLKASVEGYIQHERTSVIGGSSVLDGRREEYPQRQLQIDRLRTKSERDRVAEMFRR
jgi:OTT_1508-like deaminase